MAFDMNGTCSEALTILPHTWTFVKELSVQGQNILFECVRSPKGIKVYS
jgi:predicted nuclease with RNAse H fold